MGTRWKGRDSEAKAESEPMSHIVSQLQYSLIQSEAEGLLSGSHVLLRLAPQQADLLNRACFGVHIPTSEGDEQWFNLGSEEAFYLCHALKCLKIVDKQSLVDENGLWQHMKGTRKRFPLLYKAYSHLRMKNWVVTCGVKYGADFVAYRHHPGLVHSEFAVLVLHREGCNARLNVWSDVHCAIRLCGGVAKTLLVVDVARNGCDDTSPSCLQGFSVSERTISRWLPEQCRDDPAGVRQ